MHIYKKLINSRQDTEIMFNFKSRLSPILASDSGILGILALESKNLLILKSHIKINFLPSGLLDVSSLSLTCPSLLPYRSLCK